MAITKKISGMTTRSELNGSEYLMVAYNNRSYKIPTSLLISDKIENIEQTINKGDEKNNPIKITTGNGTVYNFSVYNGAKGSTGNEGSKGKTGETGNSGVAVYNTDYEDIIVDSLNGSFVDEDGNTITLSDEELTHYILSAAQGMILNNKLEALAEEYCVQDEYDSKVEKGLINNVTKYFILEDEA